MKNLVRRSNSSREVFHRRCKVRSSLTLALSRLRDIRSFIRPSPPSPLLLRAAPSSSSLSRSSLFLRPRVPVSRRPPFFLACRQKASPTFLLIHKNIIKCESIANQLNLNLFFMSRFLRRQTSSLAPALAPILARRRPPTRREADELGRSGGRRLALSPEFPRASFSPFPVARSLARSLGPPCVRRRWCRS